MNAYMVLLLVAVAILLFSGLGPLILSRRRPRVPRGILGVMQDGPNKGEVVAISLEGPAAVFKLVKRDKTGAEVPLVIDDIDPEAPHERVRRGSGESEDT